MPDDVHHITLGYPTWIAPGSSTRASSASRSIRPVEVNHDALGNAIARFRDPDDIQWELFEE